MSEDIELTAVGFEESTETVTLGPLNSAADHEYFEKAYVKRFANVTVGEADLPSREESSPSSPRPAAFRHTVF